MTDFGPPLDRSSAGPGAPRIPFAPLIPLLMLAALVPEGVLAG